MEELATTAEKTERVGNMGRLEDTKKKITEKYSKPERSVKDKEDKPITEIQEQRNRCVEHLNELLSMPASLNPPDIEEVHTNLPIATTPPTIKKVKMAIRQMESEKAGSPGNILVEALRSNMEVILKTLHVLFRKILEEKQVPTN
ncbi:unnamed protein product [Schistosoma curassoni]|uniref:Uncharacterized protein n=1 Tax=Schistosoma curassoni TaxID=6186 RepID=A0A183JHV2_9TREM|nr:unnamed protein product [Schistosoma curassoni]